MIFRNSWDGLSWELSAQLTQLAQLSKFATLFSINRWFTEIKDVLYLLRANCHPNFRLRQLPRQLFHQNKVRNCRKQANRQFAFKSESSLISKIHLFRAKSASRIFSIWLLESRFFSSFPRLDSAILKAGRFPMRRILQLFLWRLSDSEITRRASKAPKKLELDLCRFIGFLFWLGKLTSQLAQLYSCVSFLTTFMISDKFYLIFSKIWGSWV